MTLWCVNIEGPDDIVACRSYIGAVAVANAFNAWWQEYRERQPLDENDARMWAAPREWTGSPDQHAAACEAPSTDYLYFIDTARTQLTPSQPEARPHG